MHIAKHITTLLLLWSSIVLTAQDWKPLFEHAQLKEFQQLNGTATYTLENGVLTGTTKHNTPNSFLATKEKYGDFILEFEVLLEFGMNSGVQFRSATQEETGRVYGYQAEIETSERKWAGGIYDEARRGWLYPLSRNPKGQAAFKNGTWNAYRIEAIGNSIRTWVNGVPCANLVDAKSAEGFIAFQVHSIAPQEAAGKEVKWRNMRILTENLQAHRLTTGDVVEISYLDNQLTPHEIRTGWRLLWDGKTTEGWRSNMSNDFPNAGWRMEDGVLAVEAGGKGGNIMTREQFDNFELSVDFKVSKAANSGIKYFVHSSIQGKDSAIGLEFQILDDVLHPDAKQGVRNNRTVGALYDLIPPTNLSEANRSDKRFNISQFNRARIVVKAGQVEHWLNDIKIVEYDRFSQVFSALLAHSKYKDIKGFGQVPTGHILLQDHGDLVAFKNIKIREW